MKFEIKIYQYHKNARCNLSEKLKTNYLDNEEIYIELCHWKFKMYALGTKNIKSTDKIGQAISLTTEGLSRHCSFFMYTWKEDMIGNGIESMIKGMFNFKEMDYMNPHGYISKSAENAFLQTLEREERTLLATYKMFLDNYKDSMEEEGFISSQEDVQYVQEMVDRVKKIEDGIARNKKRRKLLKWKREMTPLAKLVYGDDIIEKIDNELKETETFYNSVTINYKDRGRIMILESVIKQSLSLPHDKNLQVCDVVEYMASNRNFEIDENMKMKNSYVDITFMDYEGEKYVDIKWQTEDFN